MGLARRLWFLLVVPLALVLGLYGVLAHQHRSAVLLEDDKAELRDYTFLFEAALEGPLQRGEIDVLHERMEVAAKNADRILGFALYDVEGHLLFATKDLEPAPPELAEAALRALTGDEVEEPIRLLGRLTLVRSVARRAALGRGERKTVCAVIVRDLSYSDKLFGVLDRGLMLSGAVLLMLTLFIVAFVTRVTVGLPAQAIVRGAERVAAGDLEVEVPEEGADEIARLAAAFNAMTRSLVEARRRLDSEVSARGLMERRLQQMQALAAAGQVAASLGHEIGSPLNVILGRAQRAAGLPGVPDKVRGELETIAKQSERISRVVGQLLAVARPQRSLGRGSDLVRVVEDSLSFVAPELRHRNVRVHLDKALAVARVALDADRTFQIVFNLVMNAAEAQRGADGEVFLRVEAGPQGVDGAARVVLEVEDRGPGVPEEQREHLFEPFFTTKGESGGSGLGLAIVQGIVREAGGTIEVAEAKPSGAIFRVSLPEDLLPVRSLPPVLEVRS